MYLSEHSILYKTYNNARSTFLVCSYYCVKYVKIQYNASVQLSIAKPLIYAA